MIGYKTDDLQRLSVLPYNSYQLVLVSQLILETTLVEDIYSEYQGIVATYSVVLLVDLEVC